VRNVMHERNVMINNRLTQYANGQGAQGDAGNGLAPPQESFVPARGDGLHALEVPEVPASTFFVSERLWYRAPEASDAPLLAAWWNDRRVRRWMTPPFFPCAAESVKQRLERLNPSERGKANDHAKFVFGRKGTTRIGTTRNGTAAPIGDAGLYAIDWIDRQAEFGISIDPAHWNQGYGREVTGQMLRYAFDELNLHRVELRVIGNNFRGIKAYQACGFVHEGTKRQAAFLDGRWEDVLLMAVLREEWAV
jgi:RimJ/RimL family protein N-acetyltransferase